MSLENEPKRVFSLDFADNLHMSVDEYPPEGKGDMPFFEAPTQADPCLAKMMVDEKADAIILDDFDFSMHVGTNGIDLMVKEISIKMTGDPISSCRLC
jgi:hypothetical protein